MLTGERRKERATERQRERKGLDNQRDKNKETNRERERELTLCSLLDYRIQSTDGVIQNNRTSELGKYLKRL